MVNMACFYEFIYLASGSTIIHINRYIEELTVDLKMGSAVKYSAKIISHLRQVVEVFS